MRIRPAEPGELLRVVDVFWQCWTQTYAASPTLQQAMDPDRATALWTTALADLASTTLLADQSPAPPRPAPPPPAAPPHTPPPPAPPLPAGSRAVRNAQATTGGVLGVVRFRQERDGQGYLASLYVAPDAHGRGVGRALLTAAEQALADDGAAVARLWVFALNTGAQEFYRRGGWRPDGQTRTQDGFGEPELGMTKALARSARPGGRTTDDAQQDDGSPVGGPAAAGGTSDSAAGGAGARSRGGDRLAGGG